MRILYPDWIFLSLMHYGNDPTREAWYRKRIKNQKIFCNALIFVYTSEARIFASIIFSYLVLDFFIKILSLL